MKKLLLILIALFFVSHAYADIYCKWSGTEGTDCQNIEKGYIWLKENHPIAVDAANLAEKKFYLLVVTQPTIGADQKRGAVVWGFTGSEITKTWTVLNLSTKEIDERDADVMPLSEYLLWKLIVDKGVATQAELQTYLQGKYPEIIKAYKARDKLENP